MNIFLIIVVSILMLIFFIWCCKLVCTNLTKMNHWSYKTHMKKEVLSYVFVKPIYYIELILVRCKSMNI